MNEQKLKDLVEKIMREGTPLFVREQIEKMLLRMHRLTSEPLECCANCILYVNRQGQIATCRENFIHKDNIQPWKVCKNWEWDNADKLKRFCRE
jgi:hypothetical protein